MSTRRAPAGKWAGIAMRLGAALLVLALPGVSSAEVPARRPEVQEAIARLVAAERAALAAAPQADAAPPAPPSPAALDELVELAGGRQPLLTQLVLHLGTASGTENAMSGAVLLHRYEFTVAEKVGAALPLLPAEERAAGQAARSLLASVDREPGPEVDFSPYLPHLRDPDAETTRDLAAYMMESDTDAAFAALRTALGPAAARPWDEAPFARLATDSRWWVRLYAAALAARHPDLASSPSGEALAGDSVPQVRRLLTSAAAGEAAAP